MGAEKGVQIPGQDRGRAGPTECPVGEITHRQQVWAAPGRGQQALDRNQVGMELSIHSSMETSLEANPL